MNLKNYKKDCTELHKHRKLNIFFIELCGFLLLRVAQEEQTQILKVHGTHFEKY